MVARRFPLLFLVFVAFTLNVFSEISVEVFSRDEGLHENNITKPRIYIENTGDEPISNFYYFYYFRTDGGKMPVLEDYYTPKENVRIVHLGGNEYAVKYDCRGVTLEPGQILPDQGGNVVGIHYPGWEPLNKDNDLSCNFSSEFAPNRNIAVFLSDGFQIYGKGKYAPPPRVVHKRTVVKEVITEEPLPPPPPKKSTGSSIDIHINLQKK